MSGLPAKGLAREEIFERMRALSAGDIDWRRGRSPLYVFRASDEIAALGRDAFVEFFTENALGGKRAFFGLKKMEEEIVAIGLDLFHAPEGAAGYLTTGGSESIIAAVKACRDFTRKQSGRTDQRGNIVAPYSAHPAFTKAARLMDLELRRIPVGSDYRADVPAMARAIDPETFLLVGSAPCFSYGTIDPIADLGRLAHERRLWLHVDACVGGYLAPFAKKAGHPVPDFDFSVPGVTSLSADLHKFGFCPKPASTVFYRTTERAACQPFEMDDWPGGKFATNTLVGTRPGGAVAGAWATLHAMGEAGYVSTARDIMALADAYRQGIEALGMHVLGQPDLSIVAFSSHGVDILRVAEAMAERGWLPGLVRDPPAMHLMLSMLHGPAREDYLRDLAASLAQVRVESDRKANLGVTY
jgi:glutamate/tyrosine decarboxylase-like PLP-dependent enzyme